MKQEIKQCEAYLFQRLKVLLILLCQMEAITPSQYNEAISRLKLEEV